MVIISLLWSVTEMHYAQDVWNHILQFLFMWKTLLAFSDSESVAQESGALHGSGALQLGFLGSGHSFWLLLIWKWASSYLTPIIPHEEDEANSVYKTVGHRKERR